MMYLVGIRGCLHILYSTQISRSRGISNAKNLTNIVYRNLVHVAVSWQL
jgi:hypothetical protein